MKVLYSRQVVLLVVGVLCSRALAKPADTNYDQTKVPKYSLPEALVLADGGKVLDLSDWQEKRRPEILELFRTYVYGHVPKVSNPKSLQEITFEVTRETPGALDGKALRKEVSVYFTSNKKGPKMELLIYLPGQKHPQPSEWGSIAAWAWGLSRAMDYLEADKRIDSRRVAVFGHSRLGKTALWASAEDERFALVISNNSGC